MGKNKNHEDPIVLVPNRPKPRPVGGTPVSDLYYHIQGMLVAGKPEGYLAMSNPDLLYAMLGAVAANMLEGKPVWLMFIGPPGSGKTEFLNSLLKLPHVLSVSSMSGEQGYLSGSSAKDKKPGATGGLLLEIGPHGLIIDDDATGILGMHPTALSALDTFERHMFDGRVNRGLGTDGGRRIPWQGKVGKLAGITDAIDTHHAIAALLGQRWVNFRVQPEPDWLREVEFVALNAGRVGWQDELASIIGGFFLSCGLEFGHAIKPEHEPTRPESIRMHHMAKLAAHCRGGVTRDRTGNIISHRRGVEVPKRLSQTLHQLFKGMSEIGVPETDMWRILTKIALDSMPAVRLDTIMLAWRKPDGIVTSGDIRKASGMSLTPVKNVIDDLEHHGVLEKVTGKQGELTRAKLTDWVRQILDEYFKESI